MNFSRQKILEIAYFCPFEVILIMGLSGQEPLPLETSSDDARTIPKKLLPFKTHCAICKYNTISIKDGISIFKAQISELEARRRTYRHGILGPEEPSVGPKQEPIATPSC